MVSVKETADGPADILLSAVVGFAEVLQQMPLSVTDDPPSDVMAPPLDAVVEVMEDGAVVVTVGVVAEEVVKVISLP